MTNKVALPADHVGLRPSIRRLELAGELFADSSDEDEETCEAVFDLEEERRDIRRRDILPAAANRWIPDTGSNMGGGTDPVVAATREICITIPPLTQMCERAVCGSAALGPSGRGGGSARTTLMLQRISYELDEAGVRAILDARGFAGTYNAVYVPHKSSKRANLGYAFVNFECSNFADMCISTFSGTQFGQADPSRTCSVAYSKAQGLAFMSNRIDCRREKSEKAVMRAGGLDSDGSHQPA